MAKAKAAPLAPIVDPQTAPSPASTYWVPVGPSIIPAPALGYGTTLPGSPVDGQEYVLVDSTTNPSYQWRFRYNASSTSAYKWEFVGGAPIVAGPSGSITTSSTTAVVFTGGPDVVVPRPGDYDLVFGANAQNSSGFSGVYQLFLYSFVSGVNVAPNLIFTAVAQYNGGELVGGKSLTGVTAGAHVTLPVAVQVAEPSTFTNGWFRLTPRRVS